MLLYQTADLHSASLQVHGLDEKSWKATEVVNIDIGDNSVIAEKVKTKTMCFGGKKTLIFGSDYR